VTTRYLTVARRAKHRCEYCHAPEIAFNFPFEVDHIMPAGEGGNNDDSNLALGCRSCNLYKSNATAAIDKVSGDTVRLFDPRQDAWDTHFAIAADSSIRGVIVSARATIEKLRINSERQIAARQQWTTLKLFP
jgi:hypothetical protein